MADVKISCRPNGPLRVEGPIELFDGQGNPIPYDSAKQACSLCRCGMSQRKPFCDGSHSREGWQE